jgi:hypothetical protein
VTKNPDGTEVLFPSRKLQHKLYDHFHTQPFLYQTASHTTDRDTGLTDVWRSSKSKVIPFSINVNLTQKTFLPIIILKEIVATTNRQPKAPMA